MQEFQLETSHKQTFNWLYTLESCTILNPTCFETLYASWIMFLAHSRFPFMPGDTISSYRGVGYELSRSKLKWLMGNRIPAVGIPTKKNYLTVLVLKIDKQERKGERTVEAHKL